MMAGENRVIDLDAMGATVTALENANRAMGSHLETIVSTTNSVKSSYDGPGTEDLIKTAGLMTQRFATLKESIEKMKKTLQTMTTRIALPLTRRTSICKSRNSSTSKLIVC